VGPRAGLDRCGKSRPHRDSIPGLWCIHKYVFIYVYYVYKHTQYSETHQLLVSVSYVTCNVQINTRTHFSETCKGWGGGLVAAPAVVVVVAKLYNVHLKVIRLS
jgi:hypothetical protein